MSGPQPPFLVVIAGSNGAGKSTWTAAGRVPAGIPVLDPDAIARALRPDAPHLAAVQAGREALRLQRAYLAERRSFAVETTLSGSSVLRLMVEARNQGFGVELLYVGVEDVRIALRRIAMRVARGGHDIPAADVRRRYGRSLGHLRAAIAQSDCVRLIDNTAEGAPREVLVIEAGQIRVRVTELPGWVRAALGPLADLHATQWPTSPEHMSRAQHDQEEKA